MDDRNLLVIRGEEVEQILDDQELRVLDIVKTVYLAHARGATSAPNAGFLRFPHDPTARIIAAPALLDDGQPIAGVKWVASFPGNIKCGMNRASSILVLNSAGTGRPHTVIEGSPINVKRTAASAALAARYLADPQCTTAAIIGCGAVNFETARFLRVVLPALSRMIVFDADRSRAETFASRCADSFAGLNLRVEANLQAAVADAPLVSFATTATQPHVFELSAFRTGATVLHISLRDLSPGIILACDNFVDDIEHVCTASTSVHLAEQESGVRTFINGTIAEMIQGVAPIRRSDRQIAIFSPFGLGVLDLGVAAFVRECAVADGAGVQVGDFLGLPWHQAATAAATDSAR